eukprot:PRCOL_00004326-RA
MGSPFARTLVVRRTAALRPRRARGCARRADAVRCSVPLTPPAAFAATTPLSRRRRCARSAVAAISPPVRLPIAAPQPSASAS